MSIVNNHYVYVLDFDRIDEYNDFTLQYDHCKSNFKKKSFILNITSYEY